MDLGSLRGILGIFVLLGIAYALSNNRKSINLRTVGFAGAADVQLAVELLTQSQPRRSFLECISQFQPNSSATVTPACTPQQQRAGTSDSSFGVRPLSEAAKHRASKEIKDLLDLWPRLLAAAKSNCVWSQTVVHGGLPL